MMATSRTFPPDDSLPNPPPIFLSQNAKQAVIYNKKGTKCMNIVKELSPTHQSPMSSPTARETDIMLSNNSPNQNGTSNKKKKKKKAKRKTTGNHEDGDLHNGITGAQTPTMANFTNGLEHEEMDDDEYFTDDDAYDPEAPEIPFPRKDSVISHESDNHHTTTSTKKKKKKKKNKAALALTQLATNDIHQNTHQGHIHKSRKDGIWNTNNNEERQRIREFWLQLGEEERRSLVKVEKEMVLKKMKEQQKSSCSCSVCGRKRTAIEEELESLYDTYYEELEQYANQQEHTYLTPSPVELATENGDYDDEDDEDDYEDDEDDDEDDYDGSENGSDARLFQFGNILTGKGGILTVAEDLLKNDGKKFLEMMERLAERRMQRENEEQEQRELEEEEEEYDEEYEDDGEEDTQTEEQRMEESKQMFQVFAARMFEQRVLNAYKEKVAQERQKKFLEELEEENRLKEEREQKKLKEKEKKNAKKRAQKQQKEEERARKEAERLAEEAALRAERERKLEEDRKKREEERLRKEAERRAREEERLKREEEKRRKAREEREKEERRRKEQEAKERKEREERERKEREERARKEQEAKERKEREEKERKAREEKERKIREEQERKEREELERKEREERTRREEKERKEREERERKEREEKQRTATLPPPRQHFDRKQSQQQRQITPIGQPPISVQSPAQQNLPSKAVGGLPNGTTIGWLGYSNLEGHQQIPPPIPISPPHLTPPHAPHIYGSQPPQQPPPYGGQGAGAMNAPSGIPNDIGNDVYTNNKKVVNPPPPQTNTIPGMNPTSSLFATGLGSLAMVPQHHHAPVIHPHQQMKHIPPQPPRGFSSISTNPHLSPPGVPPPVASPNLILNESVITNTGNIGSAVPTIGTNQPSGYGGLPLGGPHGPLGAQTLNLGTQVIGQPPPANVLPNAPLQPIGHSRRMSTHHEDSHVIQPPNTTSKAIQRPTPIQRPRRGSTSNVSHLSARSPPPGFSNVVGPGVLRGDDEPIPMSTRRQSLATPLEASSYFSNSLFSALPGNDLLQQQQQQQQRQQNKQKQSPQQQPSIVSSRTHRHTVSELDWPPIRRTETIDENSVSGEIQSTTNSVGVGSANNATTNIADGSSCNNASTSSDMWVNVGSQSLWNADNTTTTTATAVTNVNNQRRVMEARDFGLP